MYLHFLIEESILELYLSDAQFGFPNNRGCGVEILALSQRIIAVTFTNISAICYSS
jgi:hypothetical protein